jgi:hypothetical protein
LVEVVGTPFAKAYTQEDGSLRTEIRLNVSKTNILRPTTKGDDVQEDIIDSEIDAFEATLDDYNLDEDEF